MEALLEKQKWPIKRRNFSVEDILLLKDGSIWNKWKSAKEIKTYPEYLSTLKVFIHIIHIKSIQWCLGISNFDQLLRHVLVQPTVKVIFLVESNDEVRLLEKGAKTRNKWIIKMKWDYLEGKRLRCNKVVLVNSKLIWKQIYNIRCFSIELWNIWNLNSIRYIRFWICNLYSILGPSICFGISW